MYIWICPFLEVEEERENLKGIPCVGVMVLVGWLMLMQADRILDKSHRELYLCNIMDTRSVNDELREKVSWYMSANSMTYRSLAFATGVHYTTLFNLLNRKTNPSHTVAMKLLKVVDTQNRAVAG